MDNSKDRALRALWGLLVKELRNEWACEFDAEPVYELVVAQGLMELVAYDPNKHGEIEVEEGDMVYLLTPFGRECLPDNG